MHWQTIIIINYLTVDVFSSSNGLSEKKLFFFSPRDTFNDLRLLETTLVNTKLEDLHETIKSITNDTKYEHQLGKYIIISERSKARQGTVHKIQLK